MASLCVFSPENNFSHIINKNPASGMSAKELKKGYTFGYFSNENQYNVVFFDGMDEISFPTHVNQEFEYLDYTRYSSPLFVFNTLKNFFSGAMNKPNEFDKPGSYTFQVTSVQIKRFALFERIRQYFEKDFQISTNHIPHTHSDEYYNNYKLTVKVESKSMHELLNFMYMLSFFIITLNHIEFDLNIDIIKKVIKAANIVNSPYYVKYLIKFFAIKNTKDFAAVKDLLNENENHKFNFKAYSNFDARYNDVMNQLISNKNVVDVGCGEGNYLKIAEKIETMYYAIDRDEEKRSIVKKKVDKHNLKNVEILESIDAFFNEDVDNYIVLLSEVIEHNSLEDATNILKRFFNDEQCKKIIITTPNKDFNKFYLIDDNATRHDDHKFEFTEQEAISYFENLVKNTRFKLKIKHLGDEVDNIPTTLLIILTLEG